MPIISRIGAITSKAWGQFKSSAQALGGYLYIWGSNYLGGFGNNEISSSSWGTPLQVSPDISTPATPDIAVGENFAVQVRGDGSLWTWGLNASGRLGDGTTISRSNPVQIGTLTTWRKVSGGNGTGGAIKSDGTLWVWGKNNTGQLGDSTTIDKSSPIQVGTLTTWNSLSIADLFSGAIKTDGTLWMWGLNSDGRLGDGTTLRRSSPVQIGTLTTWSVLALGNNHTLALKTDGTLWGWGYNQSGSVGDGGVIYRSSPVQIGALTTWTQIMGADELSFGLRSDNTLWSWGRNNVGGLGLNIATTIARSSPTQIPGTTWQTLAKGAGSLGGCIRTDGTLWVWGENQSLGALGDGTTQNRSSPVQVGASRTWGAVRMNKSNWSAFVDKNSTVFTTGANGDGQLGQGTTVHRSSPIIIGAQGYWGNTTGNNAASMSITKVNNSLWSWGLNDDGEIGNGTTINISSPVQVGALTNWKVTSTGYNNTCAIKTDGSLWSWGGNSSGQIGDNTTISKSSPVQIGGSNNWREISSGSNASYAINYLNELYAWGFNAYGQVPNNTIQDKSSPIQIGAETTWRTVAGGGNLAFGLKDPVANGGCKLFAWGFNLSGNLGDGTTIHRSSPVQIGLLTDWATIAASSNGGVAVKTDGTLWCWGDNNWGQVGDGTTISKSSPVQIGTLTNWARVSGMIETYFAIKTDGTLWGWGYDGNYQLAQGNNGSSRSSPIQIGTLTNWSSVSGAQAFVKGFSDNNNSLYMWGDNLYGTLGQNAVTLGQRSSPVQVGADTWIYITKQATLAIKSDKTLWGWGSDGYGVLGDSATINKSSPVQIGALSDWSKIEVYNANSGSIKTSGTLWCWGRNNSGAVGDGTTINRSSPVQIGTLNDWKNISVGSQWVVATKTDGTLWSWGFGSGGRLGLGNVLNKSSPTQIGTLAVWNFISAGQNTGHAIRTNGQLWGWGNNGSSGRLGNGTTLNTSSPVQIGTLTDWAKVSGGVDYTLAVKTDGTLWAWGNNSSGQLGQGGTLSRSSPVQIGTLTTWSNVSAGYQNATSLAIKTDGTLWAWGDNSLGQVGDLSIEWRSSPVQVGSETSWTSLATDGISGIGIKST